MRSSLLGLGLTVLVLQGCDATSTSGVYADPTNTLSGDVVAPPFALSLEAPAEAPTGVATQVTVRDTAPNTWVYLAASANDTGTAACPAVLRPTCLFLFEPYVLAGQARSNANGVANIDMTIPTDVPFDRVYLQAVTRTPRDVSTSNVVRVDIEADVVEAVLPPALVGFGAETTGGRGGDVYMITNTSDDANTQGSVRWALNQGSADDPRVLLFMVEGAIRTEDPLVIDNSNLTMDGSFAPGRGVWFEGERVEFAGSNVLVQHLGFLGNDDSVSANSDAAKIGVYTRNGEAGNGTFNLERLYFRHCAFLHGRDETFAITQRQNNSPTGNVSAQITLEATIVGEAVGYFDEDDADGDNDTSEEIHKFGVFMGDGTEGLTMVDSLITNVEQRSPLVTKYAGEIEFVNNVVYNGAVNVTAINNEDSHVIGNVYRMGPLSAGTFRPIRLLGDSIAYVEDNIVVDASNNSSPATVEVTSSATRVTTPRFNETLTALPAEQVLDRVTDRVGPIQRGGVRDPIYTAIVDDVLGGSAPAVLRGYPGTTPAAGQAVRSPGDYFPADYLQEYPNDTALDDVISGGPWDGYQVWERVSAWQTRL